ncbi:hypothetical protein K1X76_08875 [bacterium]|nr:hypothetical protein [bacterium]
MKIHATNCQKILALFAELRLLSFSETQTLLAVFDTSFPFKEALSNADSIHAHVRVDNTQSLPQTAILAAGAQVQNKIQGYVKYLFPEGINMIFSSITIAEDDLLLTPTGSRPFLDHIGIDIRDKNELSQKIIEKVPLDAMKRGWKHVHQGETEKPVYCCHAEVAQKDWIYPPLSDSLWKYPIEFAYGPLILHENKMGCDLRPINPDHKLLLKTIECAEAKKNNIPCCN